MCSDFCPRRVFGRALERSWVDKCQRHWWSSWAFFYLVLCLLHYCTFPGLKLFSLFPDTEFLADSLSISVNAEDLPAKDSQRRITGTQSIREAYSVPVRKPDAIGLFLPKWLDSN